MILDEELIETDSPIREGVNAPAYLLDEDGILWQVQSFAKPYVGRISYQYAITSPALRSGRPQVQFRSNILGHLKSWNEIIEDRFGRTAVRPYGGEREGQL